MDINRRKEQRKEIRIPSILEKNGVQTKILLVDLSQNGLGFISSSHLEEGEVIQIILTQDDTKIIHPVSVQVKIQNSRPDERLNRFGALITDLQEGYQSIIDKLFHPIYRSKFASKMQTLKA
ncbi:PilZ domain-containing protein [Thiomicrorhabdus indica]|uniref:PilZ domain-containing protein n=1 Tax=Thiomicrorhabdus indica TaxID=2267253 RepID=UPI00102DF13F|nr:PilZ domain-containing protein [Thiomicrorhabdus indica]